MRTNLPYRAPAGAVSADPAMRSIDAAAAKFAAAATSVRTRQAYLGGLRDFAAWCSDFDLAPLPALPQTVARYLTDLAERGRSVSTIDQRAAAIAFAHSKAGHDSPTRTEEVRRVLAGIKRTVDRRPAKKQALTADLVAKVVKKIPARDPRGLRDRALILLCFGAALRRSELVALTVDQLDFQRRGLLVRLGRTKTDQTGEGRTVAVPDGKLKVGEAVRAWLDAAEITSGPVFRGFERGALMDGALSPGQFARMLKGRCAAVGLDPKLIGGHSPRRGFATSAGDLGADLRHTARHMRHAKLETTLGYMEDGDLFRESAGKGFL